MEGEFAHLPRQVNPGPVLPLLFVPQGEVHHDVAVGRDAAVVKLRLHQAALAQVERAVGSD